MTRSMGSLEVRHFILGSGGSGTIIFPSRKRFIIFDRIVLSSLCDTDTAVRYSEVNYEPEVKIFDTRDCDSLFKIGSKSK